MAEKKSDPLTSTARTSTSEKTSDAVPEYKIFKDHYRGLTKLLFNTNLTPHLIQEGIIAPADHEKLSAINTSTGKAEMVLPKITSALEAGITDSFHKMLGIMKSYGNHDAQQLSIAIEHEIAGSKNDQEPTPTEVMDELSLEFSALVADVADILNKSPINLEKLKSVCYNIETPEKSLLFSEKKSAAIRASPSVFDVFYELRGYWRWDSHRLLFTLIKRSGSQEAMEKLKQFQNKINYTKKLVDLTSYYQSVQKPLPPGYTRMIAIIQKDYSEFTLKECTELEEFLTDFFGSIALVPSSYEKSNSVKVTWYIPTEAVSGVLSRAYQAKELFQLLSISYFEIDEIVVWNEKRSYSLQAIEDSKSEMKQSITKLEDENFKLVKEIEILKENIKEAETNSRQITNEKDQEIRALIAKLDSGVGSMNSTSKDSIDQADTSLSKEKYAIAEETNKNLEIFKLETQLDEQARSYTDVLNEKDDEITKMKSELKNKSEEIEALKQKYINWQSAIEEAEAEAEAKVTKDDQAKGQKIGSVHIFKMKCAALEGQLSRKEVYLKRMKDELNEAEERISKLQKEKADAIASRSKESDHDASLDLAEKTKQVNSLQRKLIDMEKQNKTLQEKLENEKASVKASELKGDDVSQSLEEKGKQIDNLQQALQQVQNENNRLQREIEMQLQSQRDTSKLNSELSRQAEQLRVEVTQLKSQLSTKIKEHKEQNTKTQKKEQQLQSDLMKFENEKLEMQKKYEQMEIEELKTENIKLKKPVSADQGYYSKELYSLPATDDESISMQQQWMERFRQSESNIEALKKEISEQAKSYIGIIDDKDNTIVKLQSDLKKQQLERQKMITHVPKAASDAKAIIEELNDQVTCYVGLLDDSDVIIRKLQTENKQLKEQAEKHQIESKQLKEGTEQVVKRRVESKEAKEAKKWKRSSMYAGSRPSIESNVGITQELQEKLKKQRECIDNKDNQ